MNDKMKNNLILVMGAVIVVLLAYVLFGGRRNSVIPDPRLTVQNDAKSGKSPYHRVEVKNTMTKYIRPVQECYNKYLESNPQVTDGEIMVDWQIEPDGDVVKADVVRSVFSGETLGKCITDIISNIEFPPPPSGINVYADYKFIFKKTDDLPADKNKTK